MLSKQLDQCLLNLAWSLWTELGVSGVKRKHADVLILLEELVLFTAVLADVDPRLRDESLDWCSKYHRFISISRLRSLMKDLGTLVVEPYSKYAVTLNSISQANWPMLVEAKPWKVTLSDKSVLRPHASSALLSVRSRGIFGAGARADLITFFLVHPHSDFSIAETVEIGYSKRNLAEILDDFHSGGLFTRFMQGNQRRYRLDGNLLGVLKPIPTQAPEWRHIFKVLLTLRDCIARTERSSESTKVVEIRNCLGDLERSLQRLGVTPPGFTNNFGGYIEAFSEWVTGWADRLAAGKE
ncbi:MAG TPA: hypothetical protein VLF94_05565 [Chlamydiales bacterium]|nr:hypothetical protein [Chlamydiales bacterium]